MSSTIGTDMLDRKTLSPNVKIDENSPTKSDIDKKLNNRRLSAKDAFLKSISFGNQETDYYDAKTEKFLTEKQLKDHLDKKRKHKRAEI